MSSTKASLSFLCKTYLYLMRKTLLVVLGAALAATSAFAQGVPFRKHRYDGFKTHSVNSKSIVFFGNSITNMHEWWEAFADSNVVNRGVNGAETPIMLEHFETILAGRPAKVFLMMGTNDLGTSGMNSPAFVANSVRKAVKRLRKESPSTQVYVQSILPCTTNGIKNVNDVPVTNDSLKKICSEFPGVTYIDLYDDLKGIASQTISYDGTHLTMAGYRTWCKKIAPYVGTNASCVYPDTATDQNGGLGGIAGMRNTYFAGYPVKADDILVLGDDGNDWHELLHSSHVKQRGGSWGYQGIDLGTMKSMLKNIFKGRADNEEPKMVCVTLGYKEAASKTSVTAFTASYKAVVDSIRSLAPKTTIKLFAVYPSNTADINTSYTTKYNAAIKALAEEMDNVDYVEGSYTALEKDGAINADYFTNGYMTGRGYAKLSQTFAEAIGNGTVATTDADADARIATFDARTALYSTIGTAESLPVGNGVGQYTLENTSNLRTLVEEGYSLLAKDNASNEEFTAKASTYQTAVDAVLPKINLPLASTEEEEHWYQLYTPNRGSKYLTSQGAGKQLQGGTNTRYAATMWKFVKRSDNTYNIVNRADESYISPTASYDAAVSTATAEPSAGWTLSYSNSAGTFIISSGKVQLNQTNSAAVYNWSSGQTGTDRTDTGCQFAIVDAPDVEELPDFKGDVTLSMQTGAYANPSSSFNKLWTSTRTNPQITLSCPANNMTKDGSNIVLYSGQAKSSVYTINAGSGYVITGYSFKYANSSTTGTANAKTITVAGTAHSTSATAQTLTVEDLNAQTASFTLSGNNEPVIISDFVVSVQSANYSPTDEPDGMKVAISTGTFNNQGGNFHSQWTSTATDPQLSLSCAYNNMASNGDNLTLYVGSTSNSCTYKLTAPSGYVVTGYQFDFVNVANNTSTLTLKVGDASYSTSSATQHASLSGLNKRTAEFILSGENKGIEVSNFYVKVEKSTVPEEPQTNLFIYDTSKSDYKVVYRIPAVAQAKNGTLVAVADYRYSGGDIGSGKLDLRYAYSTDNGATWTAPKTLVSCEKYTDTSVLMNTGFGDPCIVADSESDRVLLLSCSGNVMFPNGTRTKHQAIARFYSNDGGQTWGEPTDISESIYSQFDTCRIGTAKSMFVGSGRIFQSRTVKVGSAYRLYCSVLLKDVNNVNKNYVLYSDNFGDSWKVLGGVNVAPIPSGADEPKAEELPDGSVLCSSRVYGGRYYNVFHFTNSEKAEGSWGNVAFSGASNQGVVAAGNSCNGEVMVLPAQRKKDGKDVFLLLQSVPMGDGRSNVGIYYKELSSLADFVNADSIAKNWDGHHQASYIGSAYSTMAWQRNNTLAFVYEESTFGGDYTIVYKNYSLETITDSAYTYKADVDRMSLTKEGSEVIVKTVLDNSGNLVGNYDKNATDGVSKAYEQFTDEPTKANYEAVNKAVEEVPTVQLSNKVKYRAYNTARGGKKYLSASAAGLSVKDYDEQDQSLLFSFKDDGATGCWNIYNDNAGIYVGSTPAVYNTLPVTASAQSAALYRVVSKVNGESAFVCSTPSNASYPAIHLDGSLKLVPWTSDAGASQWYIEPTDIQTAIESISTTPSTQPDEVYDLQGRKVTKPAHGVFIVNGKKKLVR